MRHIIDKVLARGFEHLAFAEYAEARIVVPLFSHGEIVASLNLIYIKRAMTPLQAEARFVPVLRRLVKRIEWEVESSKRRLRSVRMPAGEMSNANLPAATRHTSGAT